MSSKTTFLTRTGQAWKLHVANLAAAIGAVLIFGASIVSGGDVRQLDIIVLCIGVAMTLFGLGYPNLSVRCPNCNSRLYWMAISGREPVGSFKQLVAVQLCPVCHFDGCIQNAPRSG